MPSGSVSLSTADHRREVVLNSAIAMFAKTGYLGTPISAVAEHAQFSSAYVFKLFPSKQGLFITARGTVLLEHSRHARSRRRDQYRSDIRRRAHGDG